MNEDLKDYYSSSEGKDHALKLLGILYEEYRTAERYVHVGLAMLLGLLAYLWKEVPVAEIQAPTSALFSAFWLLIGLNVGIGLIYTWYLGVGISICDYEHKLEWMHIRPMIQSNLGICNGKPSRCSILLLSPALIPLLAGGISGVFYLTKFVIPIAFAAGENGGAATRVIGMGLTLLISFSGFVPAISTTRDFRKAVMDKLPPRNLEFGAQK